MARTVSRGEPHPGLRERGPKHVPPPPRQHQPAKESPDFSSRVPRPGEDSLFPLHPCSVPLSGTGRAVGGGSAQAQVPLSVLLAPPIQARAGGSGCQGSFSCFLSEQVWELLPPQSPLQENKGCTPSPRARLALWPWGSRAAGTTFPLVSHQALTAANFRHRELPCYLNTCQAEARSQKLRVRVLCGCSSQSAGTLFLRLPELIGRELGEKWSRRG